MIIAWLCYREWCTLTSPTFVDNMPVGLLPQITQKEEWCAWPYPFKPSLGPITFVHVRVTHLVPLYCCRIEFGTLVPIFLLVAPALEQSVQFLQIGHVCVCVIPSSKWKGWNLKRLSLYECDTVIPSYLSAPFPLSRNVKRHEIRARFQCCVWGKRTLEDSSLLDIQAFPLINQVL